MGATMSKKGTKLERALTNGGKRNKRQPYGVPAKRLAKSLAYVVAKVNRRNHKD